MFVITNNLKYRLPRLRPITLRIGNHTFTPGRLLFGSGIVPRRIWKLTPETMTKGIPYPGFNQGFSPIVYHQDSVLAQWKSMSSVAKYDRSTADPEVEKVILQPFNYLDQLPGPEMAMMLITAFNSWLKIPDDKCEEIGNLTKMLYSATILIDDIEDNSKFRRGLPTAHIVFGVENTLNSANYVYFLGLERIMNLGHPKAVELEIRALLESHRGQGMELYWKHNSICPTEEQYKIMAIRKAGSIGTAGVKIMQLFSENKSNFMDLMDILCLYAQIRDDYRNLLPEEHEENKRIFDDLTEGIFTFPIIHAIRSNKGDPTIFNMMKQRTTDEEMKKHVLVLMEKIGSLEYTRNTMKELDKQAREEIKRLGDNEFMTYVLDKLKLW